MTTVCGSIYASTFMIVSCHLNPLWCSNISALSSLLCQQFILENCICGIISVKKRRGRGNNCFHHTSRWRSVFICAFCERELKRNEASRTGGNPSPSLKLASDVKGKFHYIFSFYRAKIFIMFLDSCLITEIGCSLEAGFRVSSDGSLWTLPACTEQTPHYSQSTWQTYVLPPHQSLMPSIYLLVCKHDGEVLEHRLVHFFIL